MLFPKWSVYVWVRCEVDVVRKTYQNMSAQCLYSWFISRLYIVFSFLTLRSQQRGNQVIGDGILWKATNSEIHTFRPFSKHDSGAVTMVHQMLVYRTSHSGGAPQAVGKVVTWFVEWNIWINKKMLLNIQFPYFERFCGLVVRVSGYRHRGPGFDSRHCQIFLSSSGSTQPREPPEVNWGATWIKK